MFLKKSTCSKTFKIQFKIQLKKELGHLPSAHPAGDTT